MILALIFLWYGLISWNIQRITWPRWKKWWENNKNVITQNDSIQSSTITTSSDITSKMTLTNTQRTYLIDLYNEEKLAHDVYVYIYEKRGIKQFGNILQSEIKHHTLVENILDIYWISYDKNTIAGVYSTSWYTDLYNTLIQKWSVSPSDAIAVWVQIETMDIADIQQLYPIFQWYNDITTTLQILEEWSKKHLAAFSR